MLNMYTVDGLRVIGENSRDRGLGPLHEMCTCVEPWQARKIADALNYKATHGTAPNPWANRSRGDS